MKILGHAISSNFVLADARGLVVHEALLSLELRPSTFFIAPDAAVGTVELVAGEETAVAVAVPHLPANADVKRIAARLTVAAARVAPPPDTTSVTVTNGTGPTPAAQTFSVTVAAATLPRNVRVRLDGGDAFWNHGGTLPAGDHELRDFAEAANRYLDGARPPATTSGDGAPRSGVAPAMTLSFLVYSETAGRVRIAIDDDALEYTVLQTQTWANPLDGTVRIDRNLQLEFGDIVTIELDELLPPQSKRLARAGVRLDVSGEVGPERLLGDVPVHDRGSFATVSTDYAVAQAFTISSDPTTGLGVDAGHPVRAAGVASLVVVVADAELYVELQRDAGGAPARDAPLASVSLELSPRTDGLGSAWAYAALPAPVEIEVDVPHWIVMRSIRGAVLLAIGEPAPGGYLGGLLVNRGGQLWKPLVRGAPPGPAALARLAYLPDLDNQTAAIAVGFGGHPAQRPEVSSTVQRLTLDAGAVPAPETIVITSHARGSVALANVVQEFAGAALA